MTSLQELQQLFIQAGIIVSDEQARALEIRKDGSVEAHLAAIKAILAI